MTRSRSRGLIGQHQVLTRDSSRPDHGALQPPPRETRLKVLAFLNFPGVHAMRNSCHWIVALVVFALIGSLFGLPVAKTAPKGGGGGGPVPPGKIIYSYNGGVWEMNGDGSGKTAVSGYASGHPTRSTYNGHRWWIRTINGELWATPDGATFLQVTNAQIQDHGDGTMTVVWFEDGWFDARPTWSNGGDSFMSMQGWQWTQFSSDPVGGGPMWDLSQGIYVIPASAAELEARYQVNEPGPALLQSQLQVVVSSAGHIGGNLAVHHWSPDGTKVVYGWGLEVGHPDVWTADVGPGVMLPIDAATTGTNVFAWNHYTLTDLQWSPQADTATERIAIEMGYVYTLRPDGSGLVPFPLTTRVRWSPDGQYLAYRQVGQTAFGTYTYYLNRIPSTDGRSVRLTGDLNRYLEQRVLGWGD